LRISYFNKDEHHKTETQPPPRCCQLHIQKMVSQHGQRDRQPL